MKAYEMKQFGEEGGGLIINTLTGIEDIIGDIDYEEVGNKYTLEVIEIAKEKYDNLDEWGGW